jgi:hypothetical protein
MSSIAPIAKSFFDACEAGKSWAVCSELCRPDATPSAQAEPHIEIRTLEGYTEWMKNFERWLRLSSFLLPSSVGR